MNTHTNISKFISKVVITAVFIVFANVAFAQYDYDYGDYSYDYGGYDWGYNDYDYGNYVKCDTFTASDYRVEEGDRVTLRWNTTNAKDVDIDNGVGDVDHDGSERVRIHEDTTFTLVARDDNRRVTCQVTVRVEEGEVAGVTYTENRYQDGVVLSSTPYTGFDADTMLSVVFYSAIVLWAAAIAYAVVMKRRQKIETEKVQDSEYRQ